MSDVSSEIYENSSYESSDDDFSKYAKDDSFADRDLSTSQSDSDSLYDNYDEIPDLERVYPMDNIYKYLVDQIDVYRKAGNDKMSKTLATWLINLD